MLPEIIIFFGFIIFSDKNSNELSRFPVLLTCQIFIRLSGVADSCCGSIITLSGFNTFAGVADGLAIAGEDDAPSTQMLPSLSIVAAVAISSLGHPNRKFHIGAPIDE